MVSFDILKTGEFATADVRWYKTIMIEIYQNPDPDYWDAYVQACPDASFSHLHGWVDTLSSTYHLCPIKLVAVDGGRLSGLLPLVLFTPPRGDKRLISLPYTDAAGIIADDAAIAAELVRAALDLAADLGAQHLELRQAGDVLLRLQEPDERVIYTPHTFKTGLVRALPPSSEELWDQLDAKVRNQVRKARKCGCSTKIGGSELLGKFYRVFSENMRDLGSPVHDLGLFRGMVGILASRVFVVSIKGEVAAAAIVFEKGETLFNPWASSIRCFRPQCPNMLLYWSMLAFGADNGYKRFDFGRSTPGASTCRFKMQWGAKKEALVWHVFSRGASYWVPQNESLVDEAWKKLDIEDSRKRGPAVRRWISL